jgi:hypothetical protein
VQAGLLRAAQVAVVGGDQHDLRRVEPEQRAGQKIRLPLGLERALELRGDDAIPGQATPFRHPGQRRERAVRER